MRWIYKMLGLVNDFKAIRKGKVKRRIVRRVYGKVTGRVAGRYIK